MPRSSIYAQLSFAYSFPDPSLHRELLTGEWANRICAALDGLPYRLRATAFDKTVPTDYDAFQSEYIRVFQIGGRRGPPCPLHAGHYARDRSRTLQNLIRYYNHFGFRVTECVMPDHLAVQLEFMSELAGGEIADVVGGQRAQRDFLRSQLGWTETLAGRVSKAGAHPFYRSLATLTARLVAADQRFIQNALEGVDNVGS